MGSNKPTNEAPLRNQAYESFTEHLLTQTISPGQIVSQRELVQLTGMPLGAIREMVPRLEADGLIEAVPNRGLRVLSVDLNLVRNAFQLRMVLDQEALRHFTIVATDAEITRLRKSHEKILATAQSGVTPKLLAKAQQIDWEMHDRFIDALGNDLISAIYRTNSIKIRLIRNEDTRLRPELMVSAMTEHLAIIEALEKRDVDAVLAASISHLESARRRALRI